jgi:hypothetical protein
MLASLSSSGISDIKVDAANNVFFTGSFHGTVDFDPGASVVNLVSNGNSDIFFAKYDANGNFLLAKSFGAGAFDTGSFIALDASGSIFVSGYYRLTVDFDPGAGTANITASGTLNDVFFAKYDAAGNYLWARSLGSTSNDIPGGISVDASGNVVVAGGFNGTVDFDPGAGTVNLTALGRDIFIAKYDANGNYTWAKRIGASDTETAYAIAGDGNGGFYIAGEFTSTVDFDPDGGTANLTSNGSTDIFIARYTAAGAYMSAGKMGGTAGDLAMSMARVDADNVVATGYFQGTADFDPGPGVNNLNSAGIFDIFFGKYSSSTGALPVTLSSFTAQCTDTGIAVKWTSRQEQRAKYYTLERSNTGSNFELVAVIHAAGNSNMPVHYSFNDRKNEKITYYRLKQTDEDDTYTYSKIITATCAESASGIYLYPNPAVNEVTVVLKTGEVQSITILDAAGKAVRTMRPVAPAARIVVDVRTLQKGMYWIVVHSGSSQVAGKFVRN